MAIQKEIWATTLVENLFADNTFAVRSIDHSGFVTEGKIVHVPNAGAKPAVTVNQKTFPVAVAEMDGTDLNYALDAYSTAPIRIPNVDLYELSYDKRSSVLFNSQMALTEAVGTALSTAWVAGAGKSVTAAKFNKDAVLNIKTQLDTQDVPQEGRVILVTPTAYNELLSILTDAEQFAFSQSADAARGVIGRFLGFDFYMRSKIDSAASSKVSALAWQEGAVSHALGAVDVFENINDALYQGDIISAQVRAGGAVIRTDKAGVVKVVTAV